MINNLHIGLSIGVTHRLIALEGTVKLGFGFVVGVFSNFFIFAGVIVVHSFM